MSLVAWSSRTRSCIYLLFPISGLLLLYYLFTSAPDTYVDPPRFGDGPQKPFPRPNTAPAADSESLPPHCHFLRGIEDVFVVLKTGATEVQEKLPVHLETTLRCIPNYAIFSDFEETVAGERTHDTLRNVRNETKMNQPDFGIYNRLQDQGRQGLLAQDHNDDDADSPFGKPNNPGWRLDRWKFVPMVDEALQLRPQAKWFIFLEADSYFVWPNVLAWLSRFDYMKPLYIGSPMQIGDIIFAYSGSGIILSNPAAYKVSSYYDTYAEQLEDFTAQNFGDAVLGKVLSDIRIPLVWSWPMQVTSSVRETDHFGEGYGRRPWCFPAIAYHRMSPSEITDFWNFEQNWFRSGKNSLLLHGDVFRKYIHNESFPDRSDWDNLSSEPVTSDPDSAADSDDLAARSITLSLSLPECKERCIADLACLQYAFHQDSGKCFLSQTVVQGARKSGVVSGWMNSRIDTYMKYLPPCGRVDYIFD